ncbi:MAG TPA: isopentenyl transferase family protein, partial [Thermoanaerobaculia bacterium]|nr:isopentenyl transferase family protein [Thermoanaerobaculia bacterium]
MPRPLLAVVGATATGKSALALALAERLGGEIVNADALQVYRGFDVGTAKPNAEERRRVPHHLIDLLEPHERWSAGEFARRARRAIAEIESRRRLPIVVGGSGLYLRALIEGISPIPPGDPTARRALRERLAAEGLPALVAE